jgi:N-acetylmuramoyl-L-alanine amidase
MERGREKELGLKMLRKLLLICGCILFVQGCYEPVQLPSIVSIQPTPAVTIVKPQTWPGLLPSDWIPPAAVERRWTAIIIHHSATAYGNMAVFDKWHKEGNGWDGVGYDFVIGNGTYSSDGQVEVTFRWRQQRAGAHCGGTPGNWANEQGVGICLVGDFNRTTPTVRQLQSLARLVKFLENRYNIPLARIYGHRDTPGAHSTDCPGRNFPMSRLKAML